MKAVLFVKKSEIILSVSKNINFIKALENRRFKFIGHLLKHKEFVTSAHYGTVPVHERPKKKIVKYCDLKERLAKMWKRNLLYEKLLENL